MDEHAEQVVDPKAQAAEATELWVHNTAVRIKEDPEAGARANLALYRKIEAQDAEIAKLQADQRATDLRLAMKDELTGNTPVVWSTGPGVLGVRLMAIGLLHNGSKDIIQARVLRSKKNPNAFRVQTLTDMFRRGELLGRCAVEKREPTPEEYQNLGRDFCMNGDLTNAVISFCQPRNLAPALVAAGFAERAKWFDAKAEDKAPAGEAPPSPTFEG